MKFVETISLDTIYKVAILVVGFLVGVGVIRLLVLLTDLVLPKKIRKQHKMIIHKSIFYSGLLVLFFVGLNYLGMDMTPLMGAAGIIGIAIGFASQTSISNIISGLFMIGEEPFAVGDIIEVDTIKGIVISIDLLSIKLRTFNNQFIRIPNENIIKSNVTNITRYPIRRIDINLSFSYEENITEIISLLKKCIKENENILQEPETVFNMTGFSDSGIDLLIGIWVVSEQYIDVKNEIMNNIYNRLQEAAIIPSFPQRRIYYTENRKEYQG